jgi:heat-inducible transcriptional repressor
LLQTRLSMTMQIQLSQRQREILRSVVEEYVSTGQPVGSRSLVQRGAMTVSSSTVRAELAELEAVGLLTHPHTSAGRVPTDRGYRAYADSLLERLDPRPGTFPLDLTGARSEVEAALQATTEVLSELTRLLALVSAPPLEATTVRHVEVLVLQPRLVMAVVITSTGGVSKGVFGFDEPVDPGLAGWAAEYLNDRVAGLTLGTHLLRQRFDDPQLTARERAFLDRLRPAFTELLREEQRLYVGGAAGLLDAASADELDAYRSLFEMLDKRAAVLEVLAGALDSTRPVVRVGAELENPALREVSLVAASYGLTNRRLGTVNLIGPLRMDYEMAIRSVRSAASELSRYVENLYADN